MTPRERVSDERLAELLDAEIGPSADDAVLLALDLSDARRELAGLRVESIEGGEIVGEVTARLARIEAWAARARDGIWSGLTSMQRESVLRDYPTPGRDAPATSEGPSMHTEGPSPGTEAPSIDPQAPSGSIVGSAADAAADRLRRPDTINMGRDAIVSRADIRAVLDDRERLRAVAAEAETMASATVAWLGSEFPNHPPREDLRFLESDLRALEIDAHAAVTGCPRAREGVVWSTICHERDAARDEAARLRAALEAELTGSDGRGMWCTWCNAVGDPPPHVAPCPLAPARAAPQERPE